ncbi:uncharacterized protein LOC124279301 [Haliotis rubra]|uniref:uncharacterized protein LOC124279301 n=1 Tax=Haliotis rubra TaxID=36100 RepID=UPI001EE5DB48|nr:uncharacterized protein LOC124279301 [Haliotis rubra]
MYKTGCHGSSSSLCRRAARTRCSDYNLHKVTVVAGSSTRHRFIYNGNKAIAGVCSAPDVVLIHDAVRIIGEEDLIRDIALAAHKHGASGVTRPLISTVIASDSDGMLIESLDKKSKLKEQLLPVAILATTGQDMLVDTLERQLYTALRSEQVRVTSEIITKTLSEHPNTFVHIHSSLPNVWSALNPANDAKCDQVGVKLSTPNGSRVGSLIRTGHSCQPQTVPGLAPSSGQGRAVNPKRFQGWLPHQDRAELSTPNGSRVGSHIRTGHSCQPQTVPGLAPSSGQLSGTVPGLATSSGQTGTAVNPRKRYGSRVGLPHQDSCPTPNGSRVGYLSSRQGTAVKPKQFQGWLPHQDRAELSTPNGTRVGSLIRTGHSCQTQTVPGLASSSGQGRAVNPKRFEGWLPHQDRAQLSTPNGTRVGSFIRTGHSCQPQTVPGLAPSSGQGTAVNPKRYQGWLLHQDSETVPGLTTSSGQGTAVKPKRFQGWLPHQDSETVPGLATSSGQGTAVKPKQFQGWLPHQDRAELSTPNGSRVGSLIRTAKQFQGWLPHQDRAELSTPNGSRVGSLIRTAKQFQGWLPHQDSETVPGLATSSGQGRAVNPKQFQGWLPHQDSETVPGLASSSGQRNSSRVGFLIRTGQSCQPQTVPGLATSSGQRNGSRVGFLIRTGQSCQPQTVPGLAPSSGQGTAVNPKRYQGWLLHQDRAQLSTPNGTRVGSLIRTGHSCQPQTVPGLAPTLGQGTAINPKRFQGWLPHQDRAQLSTPNSFRVGSLIRTGHSCQPQTVPGLATSSGQGTAVNPKRFQGWLPHQDRAQLSTPNGTRVGSLIRTGHSCQPQTVPGLATSSGQGRAVNPKRYQGWLPHQDRAQLSTPNGTRVGSLIRTGHSCQPQTVPGLAPSSGQGTAVKPKRFQGWLPHQDRAQLSTPNSSRVGSLIRTGHSCQPQTVPGLAPSSGQGTTLARGI